MSLARVKVWIPGDVLTAADQNAEFNNILNNPISLISPTTGAINFQLQAHTNLVPTALSASSGSTGALLTVSTAGSPVWTTSGAGGTATAHVALASIIFTGTSTTYTPSSTSVGSIRVQLWGPGGGGAAANGATNSGGAGGAGGYAERIYAVTTSWGSVAITLPVGGTGGTVSASSGVDGAAASFTSTANPLTANGGGGGNFLSTGGAGGTASGGQINRTGSSGDSGDAVTGTAWVMAPMGWNGIGQGGYSGKGGNVNGKTAIGFSAGGGPGVITGGTGGNGAPAVCIVTEFA